MSEAAFGARIALVGNPNSGKTALFNALTGSRQKVANYPGVTVEQVQANIAGAQATQEGRRAAPDGGTLIMRTIALVASAVFRESVRNKVLYSLVCFAVLLISTAYLIGQLTAGQDLKIIKDLGLAATSVFGLFIAVFIGIGLVSKEVEKRSIYSLLAKPVERHQIVVGKYIGLIGTLAVNLAVMAVALYAVLAFMEWRADEWMRRGFERPALDPAALDAGIARLRLAVDTGDPVVASRALWATLRAVPLTRAGQPATEKTEVWITFDDENVYVSMRAAESRPERMIVNEMRRDSGNIRQGDSIEFSFDTFRDRRSAIRRVLAAQRHHGTRRPEDVDAPREQVAHRLRGVAAGVGHVNEFDPGRGGNRHPGYGRA